MKLFIVLLLSTLAIGCGYSAPPTTPQHAGTTPVLSALVPSSANSGGVAFTFEVDGASFSGNAVINFNGVAQTTTWMNAGKVTAMIPASSIMTAGTVPVTVTNPGQPGGIYGGGTASVTSTPMNFTIN
jgi:hypothetical protein